MYGAAGGYIDGGYSLHVLPAHQLIPSTEGTSGLSPSRLWVLDTLQTVTEDRGGPCFVVCLSGSIVLCCLEVQGLENDGFIQFVFAVVSGGKVNLIPAGLSWPEAEVFSE